MNNKELQIEDKVLYREKSIIRFIIFILPLILFCITFFGLDSVQCTSSLDYDKDICSTFTGFILGVIALPFVIITAIGDKNNLTSSLFGSFVSIVLCIIMILKIQSLGTQIFLLIIIAVLCLLNVNALIRTSQNK